MLDRLAWADMFENFLSNKYSAAKRFGLEGAETLIPGMKARCAPRSTLCTPPLSPLNPSPKSQALGPGP